jgi:hypothetical protein
LAVSCICRPEQYYCYTIAPVEGAMNYVLQLNTLQ